MKLVKFAVAAALASFAIAAQATVIDFNTVATGSKANGFTVAGVSFSDSMGSDLSVANYGHQSNNSNALAIFSDDASVLKMAFSTLNNSLSLSFGNDDSCCSAAGNIALLRVFFGGVQVGQSVVTLNRNDQMDQSILFTGANFDSATFAYANSSFNPINLIEIVDNIEFSRAAVVPEPASLALLGLGLFGLAMRRKSAK